MDTKVMIGVPTGEMGRHASFWDFFNILDKPEGTVCSMSHGQSPAKGRNKIIESALEHDCSHVLFIDDDMVFPADAIKRLLAHKVDIVGGHYLMRQYPHQALTFNEALPDGTAKWWEIAESDTGLKEVVATGFGFILIRTEVFEALEQPWIRLGEIQKDEWCDDIGFFNRVRAAGYKIHVDLDLLLGHISSMIVRPMRKNGTWNVELATFTAESIAFPMVRRR